MPSTFFGIEIGSRALAANQTALDVIGQNTSNVNTPGYSRQTIDLQTTDPFTPPGYDTPRVGQLGTGVTVSSINRVRDDFIDQRVLAATAQQSAVSTLSGTLSQVEQAYTEPGTSGIGQQLTNFFNAFSTLSTDPANASQRSIVRDQAEALTTAFNTVNSSLADIAPQVAFQVTAQVTQANTIAGQIADLNKSIRASVALGQQPNDLKDKRGALLEQLSGIVDVQTVNVNNSTTGQPTGEVNVIVGGYTLVQGDTASPLPTAINSANGATSLVTADNIPINLHGGSIQGLIKASTLVTGYQKDLDTLASSVITLVNAQHQAGVDVNGSPGQAFFTGTGAADIAVSAAVKSSTDAIAASSTPTPPATFASGNGDNARAIAAFTTKAAIGSASFNDYYNTKVGEIGSDSKSAQTQAGNQDKIVNQLKNQQSSVSGVSLDEELTNLLQYQKAYQAAARIINTFDDVLDRIINGLTIQHA